MRLSWLLPILMLTVWASASAQPPTENRLESPGPAEPSVAIRAAIEALTVEGFTVIQSSPLGTLQAFYTRGGLVFTVYAAAIGTGRPRIVWSLFVANPMVAGGLSFSAPSPVDRAEKDKRGRAAWESLQRVAQRVDSLTR